MNNKLFASALFAGLLIAAHANAGQRLESQNTPRGQEVEVETRKGEKLTGRWVHHGKYFLTKDNKEVSWKEIKKEEEQAEAPAAEAAPVQAAPAPAQVAAPMQAAPAAQAPAMAPAPQAVK